MMQNPGNEFIMGELHEMLNKLNNEADKLHKQIDSIKKKGALTVRQAESVVSESMKHTFKDYAKTSLLQLVERLVEMNCHLELADDELPNLSIPYMPVGNSVVKLKFLAGDNPWQFWLIDEKVDIKTVHKNLLKKHQNDLLEPYPNPKSQESVCFLDRSKIFRGIVLQAIHENRVKVLDCDSNMSKVITSDKVYRVDPDACSVHASSIKCTIQKEPINTNFWNSDLRDVFCNVLKEAVLNVRILERLAGSLPNFLVDVELKNEEEDCDGNLQQWILKRLLPELKKLTADEDESICDFLSSEALNPYHKYDHELTETFKEASIPVSRGSLSEDDNNLNSDINKVPEKCFPNIIYAEEEKTDSESLMASPSSESGIITSSDSGMETVQSKSNDAVLEKKINQSTEFRPIRPERIIVQNINRVPSHPGSFVSYPPPPPMLPPQNFPNPYRYPPQSHYNQVPYIPMHHPPPTPPPPIPAWHFQGPPLRQSHYSRIPPPPLPNTSSVNVMAPEFVPKVNSETRPQQTFTNDVVNNPCTPINKEIVHMELKKPSSLLNPGDNLVAMIAHVVSPAEFYVHLITRNNQYLDKLHDDMFAHYNNAQKVSYGTWQEARKALGEFCACKWLEDNHWYRVQVLEWAPIDNHVRVSFVDHGNIEIVHLDCIQPLVKEFTFLSMCAQLCHLAKVLPSVKHQPWSKESIQFFKSKVEVTNSSVYSVTVFPSNQKDVKNNSLSVLLFEGKLTENSKSINQEMVECGLAWSKDFPTLSPSISSLSVDAPSTDSTEHSTLLSNDKQINSNNVFQQPDAASPQLENEWDTWDPLTEEYHSVRNNPARDTDDPSVALIGYSAQDEARICHFYARDGFCRKPLCTKEHSRLRPDGVTTDKEEVFCHAFTEMSLPSVGETIQVFVTAVSSINLFYVQLPQNRGLDYEEEETLSLLGEFMNSPENVLQMKFLKVSPAVGQLVLAKWEDQWYRARVVSCDDDILEVMFVDYGSLSTVAENDLREMESRYLHLPFQAVECSLANIIPPENSSSDYEKASDTLKELIEGQEFEAEVYDSLSGENFKEMEILLKNEEGDVGERMIKTGLVGKRDVHWDTVFSPRKFYPG